MLTPAIVLAVFSTIVEFFTLGMLAFHRRLCAAHNKFSIMYATIVSVAISWTAGHIFGAVGVTALMAGMMSTVFSVVIYRFLGLSDEIKNKYTQDIDDAIQMLKDLWSLLIWFLRLITLPFRLWREAKQWWERVAVPFVNQQSNPNTRRSSQS